MQEPKPKENKNKNFTRVSQKFYNILVHASLQCVYYMIKAVQAIKDI